MIAGLLLVNLKTPNWWIEPDAICGECKKPVNRWNGIICGKYLSRRGKFRACRRGWHGKCYAVHSDDRFPQRMMKDDEDGFVDDPSEKERFKSARNGDNYLCPFQCDLCQFRNLYSRGGQCATSGELCWTDFGEELLVRFLVI